MGNKIVGNEVKSFETFRKVGTWEISNLTQNEPSCFNGEVRFKKNRVTIEEVEEPIEIYQERLEKMWVESDNHHHFTPLMIAAKSIGYKFIGEHGSFKRKSKSK